MAKLLKKIKKKHLHHPEAKGLCFLALSLFLFLSLISYTDGKQDQNFLGILGHFVAYIMLYLFGLVLFFKISIRKYKDTLCRQRMRYTRF